MFNFLLLMVLPTLIAIGAMVYFKGKVTYLEFFGQIAAVALVVGLGFGASYWSGTSDTEVWNGQVTSKTQDRVSCSHDYKCRCRSETTCTGSGKNRSCTSSTVCDTCYEHSYDVDWAVHASTGESSDI